MIKSKISYIVLVIMITGTLFLGMNATQTAAVGTVNADVEAGDTYYYKVNAFPTFNDILDLTGASANFNATNSLSFNGGLAGSEIYAKVMDVNLQEYSYWDGTNVISSNAPAVDLSAGLITGAAIDVTAVVDGVTTDVTIPSGVALPIPVLFSTSTYFNASAALADPFVPMPLVLNNEYSVHETVFDQIKASLPSGTIDVTNDAAQFKADFINVGLGNFVELDGFVSYNKPSGKLQQFNVEAVNTSTNDVLLNIDIEFAREVHTPLGVEIGDTFELSISQASFDYSVNVADTTEDANIEAELGELKTNMTNQVGNVLIEFEVVEVRGMYYSIEGSISDGNGGTQVFPEPGDPNRSDLWMHGFGRLGPGMALPAGDPARTYLTDEFGDFTSDRAPIHTRAVPGPFSSADYNIFHAWDKTLTFLVSILNEDLQNSLAEIGDDPGIMEVSSSTTADPQATLAFTSDSSASHYGGWELSADLDVVVWENTTDWYVQENVTSQEIAIDGNAAVGLTYDNTVLRSGSFSADFSIGFTEYNDSQVISNSIAISNFIVEYSVSTTVEAAPDGVPGADPGDGDGGLIPGLDLPGFEAYVAVISFVGMAIVVRSRSRFD